MGAGGFMDKHKGAKKRGVRNSYKIRNIYYCPDCGVAIEEKRTFCRDCQKMRFKENMTYLDNFGYNPLGFKNNPAGKNQFSGKGKKG